MANDPLDDFERDFFTADDATRVVYRMGTGPAVIVIAEMPGITPKVADVARRIAAVGCTAVMPHLFGTPGRDIEPSSTSQLSTGVYLLQSLVPTCISREFTVFATGRTSPVVSWLRALAAHEHERCGGPGVGAIGMCFTGGFALAMAADDRLLAPVLSQPSMPVAIGRSRAHGIDIDPADLERVKERCAKEGLEVIGLRFRSDRLVPAARFEFLREQLGDAFIAIELEDDAANPAAAMAPHSVLTEHLIDEPGQPTREALDQVLDLFRRRLVDMA